MPMLPFSDWRPDVSSYMSANSQVISNVVPRADGYGPFQDFTAFTSALPAACRGFFYARKADGSVAVFAGTSVRLYQLNNTDLAWTHVSKGLADYSALPTGSHWQFAQFGSLVIAVQPNVVPQVFDLSSSTEFADLGGSPPQAAFIAVVGRFVVHDVGAADVAVADVVLHFVVVGEDPAPVRQREKEHGDAEADDNAREHERLREREFGILDRLTRAGIEAKHPEQAAARAFLGKFYHRPPGGESWADVALRLRSLLDTIGRQYAGERLLVVTHQVVILVPELDDYLRPAEATERFASIPHARLIAVDGGKHLWVGESQTRRVLTEIVAAVNPAALPLPTPWSRRGARPWPATP